VNLAAYCDCAALRRLLAVPGRAAARRAELRLAAPLASPVRRVLQVTVLDRQFRLCPAAARAAAVPRIPASPHPALLTSRRRRAADEAGSRPAGVLHYELWLIRNGMTAC
jgi:hypothetical protein